MTERLTYDFVTGEFTTHDLLFRATEGRKAVERSRKEAEEAPPPPGYGLDGYPLMRGKATGKELKVKS